MPRALITGITGQDGRHLAEHLHTLGYDVIGLARGQANVKADALTVSHPYVKLVNGDLLDTTSLIRVIDQERPDEIYNLGAISFVALSWEQPQLVANVTGIGCLNVLEAMRAVAGSSAEGMRMYQASSSEMFGKVRQTPQNEDTPFHPRSPYGVAKAFAHYTVVNHRESYGMHASSGILMNHEGEYRGLEFVTRKITNAAARISLGLQDELVLGNLDAKRDWGYAGDFVRAMHLMLQQDIPDDYVIATGETHSVEEFVTKSFAAAGIDDWQRYVRQDPRFIRPAEVDLLLGDATKARTQLGWKPEVSFDELVARMVENDLRLNSALVA